MTVPGIQSKLDYLIDIYTRWCEETVTIPNAWKCNSADELLHEMASHGFSKMYAKEMFWLKWFIHEWELAENA